MIIYVRESSRRIRGVDRGIVLLVTLIVLVVLSTLGYTLTTRLAAQRHRNQYMIDYQAARYACDSAVKYALATLDDINSPELIERPNEPDFSDLFRLSEEEYEQFVGEWTTQRQWEQTDIPDMTGRVEGTVGANDFNNINDINDVNGFRRARGFDDGNSLTVRGPYGPEWPFVKDPIEFEIGTAKVRIEIEDENAKYPLGWTMLADSTVEREALAGFRTFCEWMDVNEAEISVLQEQLEQLRETVKPFNIEFKPITRVERTPVQPATKTPSRTLSRTRTRTYQTRERMTKKTVPVAEQVSKQSSDFARLFHSSMIDTEMLARPTIDSETREESALKYVGIWGSRSVNINTAPRHVLEAAFAFGGDAKDIAEGIIQRRRIEPFKDIDDLTSSLFRYAVSIRDCEKYITTTSSFFTIRVSATSGVAKASAVIAVVNDGEKLQRIAVVSG